jgi:hypothetical protein
MYKFVRRIIDDGEFWLMHYAFARIFVVTGIIVFLIRGAWWCLPLSLAIAVFYVVLGKCEYRRELNETKALRCYLNDRRRERHAAECRAGEEP